MRKTPTGRTMPPGLQSSSGNLEIFGELLAATLSLLLANGTSSKELSARLSFAFQNARRTKRALELQHLNRAVSHVLAGWHADPDYVDSLARPMRLTHRGPKSLESLAGRYAAGVASSQVIREMKRLGLVRSTVGSKHLPVRDMLQIRESGAALSAHVGQAILNLMGTLRANLTRSPRDEALLERAALIDDLPESLVPEFRRFAAEQGNAMTANVNRWLETRRPSTPGRKNQRLCTAGVHVFAFTGEQLEKIPLVPVVPRVSDVQGEPGVPKRRLGVVRVVRKRKVQSRRDRTDG